MLQIQRTNSTNIAYRLNPAFTTSRKCAESVHHIALSQDLLSCGFFNQSQIQITGKGSTYHFHVLNVHHVYVTIIITNNNKLTLRGKAYTKLADLFYAIDTYKN